MKSKILFFSFVLAIVSINGCKKNSLDEVQAIYPAKKNVECANKIVQAGSSQFIADPNGVMISPIEVMCDVSTIKDGTYYDVFMDKLEVKNETVKKYDGEGKEIYSCNYKEANSKCSLTRLVIPNICTTDLIFKTDNNFNGLFTLQPSYDENSFRIYQVFSGVISTGGIRFVDSSINIVIMINNNWEFKVKFTSDAGISVNTENKVLRELPSRCSRNTNFRDEYLGYEISISEDREEGAHFKGVINGKSTEIDLIEKFPQFRPFCFYEDDVIEE